VVAAVVVFSSGAAIAYAGWSSVPSSPTAQTIAATSTACAQPFKDGQAVLSDSNSDTDLARVEEEDEAAFNGQPVLAEARGIYTALIEDSDGQVYDCLTHGNAADPTSSFSLDVGAYGAVQPAPAADQISVPYTDQSAFGEAQLGHPIPAQSTPQQATSIGDATGGGGYGPSMLGQAGSDVASVSVTLDNGQTVLATVQNGWYFAWWPWGTQPKTVTVTTTSGTATTSSAARVPYEGIASTTPTSTN
jgi:hypothetical protein